MTVMTGAVFAVAQPGDELMHMRLVRRGLDFAVGRPGRP